MVVVGGGVVACRPQNIGLGEVFLDRVEDKGRKVYSSQPMHIEIVLRMRDSKSTDYSKDGGAPRVVVVAQML